MFSSRKKPPYAANFHSEGSRSCNGSSRKSGRLFLRASDITSSSELEHSKLASGAMERSARDLARMDLKLLLNPVHSETRPHSEATSRHLSRTANAKPFSDASVRMQTTRHVRLGEYVISACLFHCNTRWLETLHVMAENIYTSAGKGYVVNIEAGFLNTCNETCEMNLSAVCATS